MVSRAGETVRIACRTTAVSAACPGCESSGEYPQMETAAKPESTINKGLAGPGLLAYIVTSKFSDYVVFPVML